MKLTGLICSTRPCLFLAFVIGHFLLFTMDKNIGFKVTVEFDCTNMIDEKTFHDEFNCDPIAAYKFISDNFNDSPINFSEDDRIVKVELL
jgi:hypothetical protein